MSENSSGSMSLEDVRRTLKEHKLSKKELAIRRKELMASKKDLSSQIANIRAEYRVRSANRGSMVRGSGSFLGFLRFFQRANRQGDRIDKENAIAALEEKRRSVDNMLRICDEAMVATDRVILECEKVIVASRS